MSLGKFLFGVIAVIVVLAALVDLGNGGGVGNAARDLGQGQGSPPEAQQGEEAPVQDQPEDEPEPPPEPEPEPIELSGSGPAATRAFRLEPGLSIIFLGHAGNANFIVDLLDENGDTVAPMGLVNEIGPYTGTTAVRVQRGGQYLLDVQADGEWRSVIAQPRREDAPQKRRFSGDSPEAEDLFEISGGLHRVEMTHEGDGNFIVDLLDENGAPVVPMGLANEIGPFEGSRAMRVPDDGIYLFSVQANGPWTIEVE